MPKKMQIQQTGKRLVCNRFDIFGQQALKTAVNTYYFHPVIIDGSFAHATNGGINTGTVPAGC